MPPFLLVSSTFFFNDPATTEIYTLSLHDALPISKPLLPAGGRARRNAKVTKCLLTFRAEPASHGPGMILDRKSTRLNSSHPSISYAVFCLKKKKKQNTKTLNSKKLHKRTAHYSY